MILIYPPVAKISEPPPGVAILAGALKKHHIRYKVIDANIDAMMWLARSGSRVTADADSWSRRAVTHLERNLSDLKDINLYKSVARYQQRVMDLNRVIATSLDRQTKSSEPGSFYPNKIDKDKALCNDRLSSVCCHNQKEPDIKKIINCLDSGRFKISLSDYADTLLTPVRSDDLVTSAIRYTENPFYPFFEEYLARKIEAFQPANIQESQAHRSERYFMSNESHPFESHIYSSEYIGISLCYLSQALTAFALTGWIRARFPEKKIIMGGGLVTSWMSMPTWNNPFKDLIDCMVKGKGEDALVSLITQNSKPDLKAQSYTPDFDFCKWDKYIAPGKVLPFRTASGCYWNRCRFCPEKAEKNRYQPEKNRSLIDNLDYLVRKYKPDYLHFIDDAIPPSFLKAVSLKYGMPESGIKETEFADKSMLDKKPLFTWYGFVRFTKELADPAFCRALYRSGCRLLKLGLESGDQAVLDKMEKGTDLGLASQVLTALQNAGIHTYVYLLFGTQFENEAEADKTLDYVIRHSDRISFLNLAIFNLPRFSEDAMSLKTRMFSSGDLSLYLSFKHPDGWDRKRVRSFLEKKFKKHPEVGKILKYDPPFFTSNHAMFVV